jgi:hypothetical protein
MLHMPSVYKDNTNAILNTKPSVPDELYRGDILVVVAQSNHIYIKMLSFHNHRQ